ncbi:methyl-accepting chemotaxis protein [Geobacter sp. SVR]|uniref:methyl-accepting chemotaxis protein n=1 Tax=Geobacter sp. SVR TaxID=2495594 RepID=UPI00143EF5CD|nr:methyl-accepting chemotaxis protein [Geobacter sp. SVR]BCS52260.1 chemotaxis protein [Geobacter sp. SVR]GCF85079.1 chemotaxis protein [Geobacter sp. SVR]
MKKHSTLFSISGFLLGISAPIGWIAIRLAFFYDSRQGFFGQIIGDLFKDSEHFLMYTYMGAGTAIVLACLGYLIGKNGDELQERATELDVLHREVASQKEIFENRYRVLDSNIKNFHHISSKIQMSLNLEEILLLCAEGLHEVLGYERVNILMSQDGRTLRFVTAAGTDDFDVDDVTMPLDPTIGVIYKCFVDKKVYLIDDISRYSPDFHLQPPYNNLAPLRSRSFIVCPIVVKGEAIGAFAIDNKASKRALNDSDVDTIMLFADQVASAITRINLLTSIDTLTSEMESSFTFLLGSREQYSRNVQNLKENVHSVADGSSIIASASEGVMASVDETSTAVNEISVAIEQVTRNLDHLAGIVHQSAAAMEQINSTISNVEQNAAVSHEVSSQVKSQADESIAVVSETINSLAEIQSSVEQSYAAIKRLAENSTRIENIVSVINDITKRTNLLALNASIIAAQAGEYGKSFGVVADEIRNLSLQTGHSTGEITGIIEEIMTESRTAASNITISKNLVQRGVDLGHSTGESLRAIYDRSVRSMDMTQQIKQATEEQVTSVQVVARSMEDISSMTSQIFAASADQAKATRSIARSIETIKDMAHEMVKSTARQVDDGRQISGTVESVSAMVTEMFDNMEQRRRQSAEVVQELESMKSLTCQI